MNSAHFSNILYGPIAFAHESKHHLITDVPMEKFTEEELGELKKISKKDYSTGLKLNEIVDKINGGKVRNES